MTESNTNPGGAYGTGTTLSALFDRRSDAERAVERLREAGIPENRIRMTKGYEADPETAAAARAQSPEPRGFFEAIGDFFFPEKDRQLYAEGLSRGGYLVTVDGLSGALHDTALDILDDEGVIDLDEREAAWRAEGWTGYRGSDLASGSEGYAGDRTAGAARAGEAEPGTSARTISGDETVPVVEENLRVGKRDTSHGRVRVRSYVTERPVSEDVELAEERVEVERRAVDRPVSAADDPFQERSIEAEERREEPVVSKEARVVEEVGLRREEVKHQETVSDTVRKTDVEVEDERTRRDPDLDRR